MDSSVVKLPRGRRLASGAVDVACLSDESVCLSFCVLMSLTALSFLGFFALLFFFFKA